MRTHMFRAHGNRELARRFVADTQCPVCKKCCVTRARAVQHGDDTRCKHAMMDAPEELGRLDHEVATFRRNARREGLSFSACTMADGSACFFSVSVLPGLVPASPVSPTHAQFVFVSMLMSLCACFSSTDQSKSVSKLTNSPYYAHPYFQMHFPTKTYPLRKVPMVTPLCHCPNRHSSQTKTSACPWFVQHT